MSTYNRVLILGTLGQNPVLKNTQNGHPFCRLSLATDAYARAAEGNKKTSWHQVHVFGKTAENVARYLRKGRQVLVEGRMETDEKQIDGQRSWKTWITAERVTFVNGPRLEGDDFSIAKTEDQRPLEDEPLFPSELGTLAH